MRGCGAATVTLDRAERAMVMAMAKNRVHLKIGGSAYTVLTDDAPEYVEELAEELDKEAEQNLDVFVVADHETIKTAVKNLVENAINYSPEHTTVAVGIGIESGKVAIRVVDKADTCKKSTASSDNLRAQIKDYLEDSARARMEVDVARREIERLNREISSLRERIAENK